MLQDLFYKGVQREVEVVLESRLKIENHLRHLNDIRGKHVGAPNTNAERGLIQDNEGLPK